ncbi:type II toxin-antitoxin system RelE/ParE family toxin [Bizionia argentinensis JUB59]|uniref:Type II toxin-antitoxin system RelE/ParE family toxin n=1 Tax=Bizionia argentinensis JUB59 TaxID=1046627 RepID=G2EAR4_9FLAO|nr:type II toxin-antitoxin system RelE/ParE family toxin [Bizionia argentinensis]EGV44346.1 type II toxin-antitoxin system RelE/ParE family toxin [Bizionia argentinensis JUB59]
MIVFLSELAETKLLKLSEYLLENWNIKTRDRFIEKLSEKIRQISIQPESCPQSTEFPGLYACVVAKQITLYYRISIELQEIEIITVFDTRQNPDKVKKDIEY